MVNNTKSIEEMIRLHNALIVDADNETKEVSFFDLIKSDLINTAQILEIINFNSNLWICLNSSSFVTKSNKVSPKAFVIFDFNRIEKEIRSRCIAGRVKLRVRYPNFDFIGSRNMLNVSKSQRKKALIIVGEVIALITNLTGNQLNIESGKEFYDEEKHKGQEEDKEDEKESKHSTCNPTFGDYEHISSKHVHDKNEELWHFMHRKLKMSEDLCQIFKLKQKGFNTTPKLIQLKHLQSLWHELVKRIDDELVQYKHTCSICCENLLSSGSTSIILKCCTLAILYQCLQTLEQG